MCGIAGFLDGRYAASEEACLIARDMADAIAHRGPDDAGVWLDRGAGVALAHRRLAIIDPSPAGRQPMESVSGRHIIVFNGEIYNHTDIRRKLEIRFPNACSWRGGDQHLGTEHTDLYVSAGDVLEVIPRLPALFDEPFADHSQIPTFLVAKMARKLQREGGFDPQPIRQKWHEHLSGQEHRDGHLWRVLMFQAWSEQHRCSR